MFCEGLNKEGVGEPVVPRGGRIGKTEGFPGVLVLSWAPRKPALLPVFDCPGSKVWDTLREDLKGGACEAGRRPYASRGRGNPP